jgi:carbonic anhydrase
MTIRSPAEGGIMFISALLERNRRFAATDSSTQAPAIPFIPNQLSFVITCIDPRTEPAGFLGIELGDAIVERVVGGRVTPAILQDVAYISYLVETKAPATPGKYCRLRTQRE